MISKHSGILRFWQGICDSVILARKGSKQKEDILEGGLTLCIELNCENCIEFADQPFSVCENVYSSRCSLYFQCSTVNIL